MSRKLTMLLLAGVVLCAIPGVVSAYPGAINLIPSTDVVGQYNLRLSYEAEGKDQPYDNGYTEYIYTQFGVTKDIEIGFDSYDFNTRAGSRSNFLNAKVKLFDEGDIYPAIAVGSMFIGKDTKPSYYGVASKSFGKYCFHFGAETQGDTDWLLAGFNCPIGKSFTLLSDYQSGNLGCSTLGLYWQATDSLGVTLYGTRYNNEFVSDTSDFIGLNVAYTLPVKY